MPLARCSCNFVCNVILDFWTLFRLLTPKVEEGRQKVDCRKKRDPKEYLGSCRGLRPTALVSSPHQALLEVVLKDMTRESGPKVISGRRTSETHFPQLKGRDYQLQTSPVSTVSVQTFALCTHSHKQWQNVSKYICLEKKHSDHSSWALALACMDQ